MLLWGHIYNIKNFIILNKKLFTIKFLILSLIFTIVCNFITIYIIILTIILIIILTIQLIYYRIKNIKTITPSPLNFNIKNTLLNKYLWLYFYYKPYLLSYYFLFKIQKFIILKQYKNIIKVTITIIFYILLYKIISLIGVSLIFIKYYLIFAKNYKIIFSTNTLIQLKTKEKLKEHWDEEMLRLKPYKEIKLITYR